MPNVSDFHLISRVSHCFAVFLKRRTRSSQRICHSALSVAEVLDMLYKI